MRMTFDEFLWALREVRDDGVYAKRLKALEEQEKKLMALIGVADTVEKATKVQEQANVALAKANSLKEQYLKEHNERMASLTQKHSKMESECQDRMNAANKLMQEARQAQEVVKKAEMLQSQVARELDRRQEQLAMQEADLRSREQALKDKIAKMKELV